ncbi:hypothetical protein GP486_007581 [Trichoglossum hirsutum]|uniref:Uncharacterized protein n=1 Tax=Trichoglossum hirsutum TaxID=265104 RepID=A0A9P8L6S2_9PEZI|nr:hypothetical protein GP486_007581 [Trichoglossum hirsutum]
MISSLGFPSLSAASHASVPRAPPPPSTPLDFPRCSTQLPKLPLTPESTRNFYTTYTGIRKPSDVRLEHLEGLNVAVEHDVELEDLVPVDPADGVSAVPPRSWGHLPDDCDDSTVRSLQLPEKTLSTGKVGPNIHQFRQRCAELSYANDDAFYVVQRRPPIPGKPPVRPGQYYRFWQGLELLAQWWDTSQDDLHLDAETAASSSSSPEGRTYVGRRVGAGRDMPEQYREDCVKGFVEVIAWEFGCRLHPEDEVGKGQAEILDLMREIVGALIIAQERAREGKEEKKPGAGKWWCEAPRWGGGPGGEVGNAAGNSDDPAPPVVGRGRTASRGDRRANFKRLDRQSSGIWDKKVRYQALGKNKKSGVDDVSLLSSHNPRYAMKMITFSPNVLDFPPLQIFLISSVNHHISIVHLCVSHSYLRFLESGALPRYPVSPSLKSLSQNTSGTGTGDNNNNTNTTTTADVSPPITSPATPISLSSPTMGSILDGSKDRGNGKEARGACPLPADWYILKVRRSRWFDLLDGGDRIEAMRGIWGVFGYLMRNTEGDGDGEGGGGESWVTQKQQNNI